MKRKSWLALWLAAVMVLTSASPAAAGTEVIEVNEPLDDPIIEEVFSETEQIEEVFPETDWEEANAGAVSCENAQQIQAALDAASAGQILEICLTCDISLSGQIQIPEGVSVMLSSAQGAVYTITEIEKQSNTENNGVIYNKGALTVERVIINANGYARGIVVENGASLCMDAGAMVKGGVDIGTKSDRGLGIFVKNGTVNSYGTLQIHDGAAVTGCGAYGRGAQRELGIGVYVGSYGKFEMSGGIISDNIDYGNQKTNTSCAYGGGVYLENYVEFQMSGGSIVRNQTMSYGAGVYIVGTNRSTRMTMGGDAKVAENKVATPQGYTSTASVAQGGGIYVASGELYVTENASIENNQAVANVEDVVYNGCGGGVFVSSGLLCMSGGSITGNSTLAENYTQYAGRYPLGNGAGVFILSGGFQMSGGSITGNQASAASAAGEDCANGGGVYLGFAATANGCTTGSMRMTGGRIAGNLAGKNGDDIYFSNSIRIISKEPQNTYVDIPRAASPLLEIGGDIYVGDDTSRGIYLQPDGEDEEGNVGHSVLTLIQELTGGTGSVRVGAGAYDDGLVLAVPAAGYVVRASDRNALSLAEPGKKVAISSENQLVVQSGDAEEGEDLAGAEIRAEDVVYNGKPQRPGVTVTLDGAILEYGVDYTLGFIDNTNAGTGTVVVNGRGKYDGTAVAAFGILPKDLAEEDVAAGQIPDKYACGIQLTPQVRLSYDEMELKEGEDYTISWGENIQPGTGIVDVMGCGNYTGSRRFSFSILDRTGCTVVQDQQQIVSALETPGTLQTELILASDIGLQGEIAVPKGKRLLIHGNGHEVVMEASNLASAEDPLCAMWHIGEGAQVTMEDMTVDGQSKSRLATVEKDASLTLDGGAVLKLGKASTTKNKDFAGQCIYNRGEVVLDLAEIRDSNAGYYGTVYNAGTLRIHAGARISNVKTTYGGAIYNEQGAELEMSGGSIENANGATDLGAAVSNLGIFRLEGGTISGSSCARNVIYNVGEFTMSGGSIRENENTYMVTKTYGGSLYNGQRTENGQTMTGTFTMTGGSVEQNRAVTGGGIFLDGGTVTMDGEDARIAGNVACYQIVSSTNVDDFGNGGGVFVRSGTFLLKAGSIEDNTAMYTIVSGKTAKSCGNGGGVYLYAGRFEMTGGTVCRNKADGKNTDIAGKACMGGGIYINGGTQAGQFVMSGGIVSENGAKVTETSGIYVSNTAMDGSASGVGRLHVAGTPQIGDQVYMSRGTYLDVDDTLREGASVKLYLEQTDAGTVVARYGESSGGEFMQASDLDHFQCMPENVVLTLDAEKRTIVISKLDLSMCEIQLDRTEWVYSGKEIRPSVTVTDPRGNAVRAFSLEYKDNVDAGTGTVTVNGDRYVTEGSISREFKIMPASLEDVEIVLKESNIYTTQEITPEATLTYNGITLQPYDEETGQGDYRSTFENNINITSQEAARAIFTGVGNYSGTQEKPFYIGKGQIIYGTVSYTKTWGDPAFDLDARITNTESGAGLTYSSDKGSVIKVDAASGRVTIAGIGEAVVTVTAARTANYAAAQRQIKITVKKAAQKIQAPVPETKQYGSGSFSLNVKREPEQGGKLTFTVDKPTVAQVSTGGIVSLKGVGEAYITIKAAETDYYEAASCQVKVKVTSGQQSFSGKIAYNKVYGAKAFKLNLRALKENAALSYSSSNTKIAKVNKKTGKVTITGTGRVTLTVTAAATKNYASGKKQITLTVRPKKVTLSSAKNISGKAIKLKWKKAAKASGYQIRIATNKKFTKNVHYYVVSKSSKTTQTIASHLKKGKTYYVQVQAYTKVGKKVLTGSYSKAKTVKILR